MVESLAKPSRVTYVRLSRSLVRTPPQVRVCTTTLPACLACLASTVLVYYYYVLLWIHYYRIQSQNHQ